MVLLQEIQNETARQEGKVQQFFSLYILLYIAVLLCFTCTVLVIHMAFTTLLYSKVKFIK